MTTTTPPSSGPRPRTPHEERPPSVPDRQRDAPTGGAVRFSAHVESQAYCGPAHGHRWIVDGGQDVPAVVDRTVAGGRTVRYRLVTCLQTGRPARDHRGRYLYVPSLHQPFPGAWDGRW